MRNTQAAGTEQGGSWKPAAAAAAGGPGRLRELLGRTSGCWTHGDGLSYQNAARDEWEPRR